MKPTIKKEWVAALRSGKYKQGSVYLCATDGTKQKRYCCLGVLCDLYAKRKNKPKWKTKRGTGIYSYADHCSYLPDEVARWAGIEITKIGDVKIVVEGDVEIVAEGDVEIVAEGDVEIVAEGDVETTLATLNDGYAPFEKIADLIEKKL